MRDKNSEFLSKVDVKLDDGGKLERQNAKHVEPLSGTETERTSVPTIRLSDSRSEINLGTI